MCLFIYVYTYMKWVWYLLTEGVFQASSFLFFFCYLFFFSLSDSANREKGNQRRIQRPCLEWLPTQLTCILTSTAINWAFVPGLDQCFLTNRKRGLEPLDSRKKKKERKRGKQKPMHIKISIYWSKVKNPCTSTAFTSCLYLLHKHHHHQFLIADIFTAVTSRMGWTLNLHYLRYISFSHSFSNFSKNLTCLCFSYFQNPERYRQKNCIFPWKH